MAILSRQILTYVFVSIVLLSLSANGLLWLQGQTDRQSFQSLLKAEQEYTSVVKGNNRQLSQENAGFKDEIAAKDAELKAKIQELIQKQAELEAVTTDLTSKKTELVGAQKQIDSQKAQLSANADELSKLRDRPPLFSFQVESSTLTDVETKKAAVKQVVTEAYDVIELVYGKAYLLHSVTISFVENFTNPKASGEIVITNSDKGLDLEIRLKDFNRDSFNDVSTIIHEVIHSFHGLAAPEPTPFEEGITVAATEAVMVKMRSAGTITNFSKLYLRLNDNQFQAFQNSLSIPRDSTAFYGSDQVSDFYQVLGQAWYNLYLADPDFLKKFNEKIYTKKQNGQDITEQITLDTVREVAPGFSLTGAAWNLK